MFPFAPLKVAVQFRIKKLCNIWLQSDIMVRLLSMMKRQHDVNINSKLTLGQESAKKSSVRELLRHAATTTFGKIA